MHPYICVTYARDDRKESDLFCRGLARYGFRYSCIHELSEPALRAETLVHATLLIALTSSAAEAAETVAADIRRGLERRMRVLCVSLEGNELDHRFCMGASGGAVLIPFPMGEKRDRHTVDLFVHRLYVRHLARFGECFAEELCDRNVYGELIRCARRAHDGDGSACFELGRAYELGLGVPALEQEAAVWLRRAAEQNIHDALIYLGRLCLLGQGTDRDPAEAFRLFTRAAEQGDVRGVYHRGLCYLEGQGVMKDPVHARECLDMAARRQYAPAVYHLAILYRDGIGTERDSHAALRYLYAVCRLGFSDQNGEAAPLPITVYGRISGTRYTCITMRQMRHTHPLLAAQSSFARGASADRCFGRCTIRARELPEDRWEKSILEIRETVQDDETEEQEEQARRYAIYAEDWTKADAAKAAHELGLLLALGNRADGLCPSPTRALVWYRYAAYLGDTEALYALGDAYRRGYGTPADPERAVQLYRLAADGGSERGQFAYAACLERGIGVAVDEREAARRYEQAASEGYAPAQTNLGGCYERGIGVPHNMLTAVEWYAAAANAGQPDGQCRLGICYELGRGVPVDLDNAIRLYELAAEQGHAYALYRLALCYDRDMRNRGGDEAESDALLTESAAEGETFRSPSPRYGNTLLEKTEGMTRFSIDHTRAAALYQRAADLGVAEAAYAFYLCHRLERGVFRDERSEMLYLRRAAEGGCLQAAYELGLCYMEGNGLPQDRQAAVAWFTRSLDTWRICAVDSRAMNYLSEPESLPPDALSLRQAAGGAMYMLGYCALYGIGEARDRRMHSLNAVPRPEALAKAVSLFREAAEIDHVGSIVMLGDLYAYELLTSDSALAEDEALRYYLEAVRTEGLLVGNDEYTRGIALRDRTDNSIDALMSLAKRALAVAESESDPGNAEMARVNAWRSYSECAARGSSDALIRMAECLYHGHGAARNLSAALRLLRRAEFLDGGRIEACLWLGDALRSQWGEGANPAEADAVYLRGLECPCLESECGLYTLGLRRSLRKREDIRARAEILYRLATLRAVYFSDNANRKEAFLYLAEAILMGHAEARDDLARIFAYEFRKPKGPPRKANRRRRPSDLKFGSKARLRRRMKENGGILSRNSRALRIHRAWLCDYYTARWPEPDPFSYTMHATTIPAEQPQYVTVPVTDTMRANALQYLGECFFEGYGLPTDAAAAVTCYQAVLEYAPRGGAFPVSVTEATYSLGWCLLYGVGTMANCQEAIRLLTSVAKEHPGACYTLGLCHEEGRGVVAADDREAVKFYRRAQKLGHPKAAEKIEILEKRLNDRIPL
ncbi:MAG: sel1 repeat family protein [Ruminococcaceae bacterium]|nr:sel1 repeat family protein [Oscillospiraceae bacterium]